MPHAIPTFAELDDNALRELFPDAPAPHGAFGTRLFDKPWRYANHQVGFMAPVGPDASPGEIVPAAAQPADPSLADRPLDVRLDRLRVQDYPGVGGHKIVNFEARHQQGDQTETLSFNQAYEVGRQDYAGVSGRDVFRGLNPGKRGIGLRFCTVHVESRGARAFQAILGSPALDGGLQLLAAAQPAVAPLSAMATGLLQGLLDSEKAAVQRFDLGLDLDAGAASGHRLRIGSYIAAQVPGPNAIAWADWVWSVEKQAVVHRAEGSYLPYNYLVFRISHAV